MSFLSDVRVSAFLQNNTLAEPFSPEGVGERIDKPWGDKSLSIYIPAGADDSEDLAASLEYLYLPPEFSAVFHLDSEELEILWTAYKLRAHSEEVKDRNFLIQWEGVERRCEFRQSSERTLTLAKHCFPVSNAGSTDHRNIVSFHLLANEKNHPMLSEPISFFVDCKGLNFQEINDFVVHLNSFMIYFDRRTPRILMHSEASDEYKANSRLMEGEFPEKISARRLDPNLISYWTEAFSTKDQVMRYLLLYRIIEYASFTYIDGDLLNAVRRQLLRPSLPSSIDLSARKISEIVTKTKELDSITRVQNMITSVVELEKIWGCIENNIDYFRRDHTFDGGYTVKALLSNRCDFENWSPNGVRSTFDRLRQLRNALAHGQDGATRGTVRPTRANAHAIVPWVNILETIASDVMFLQSSG